MPIFEPTEPIRESTYAAQYHASFIVYLQQRKVGSPVRIPT